MKLVVRCLALGVLLLPACNREPDPVTAPGPAPLAARASVFHQAPGSPAALAPVFEPPVPPGWVEIQGNEFSVASGFVDAGDIDPWPAGRGGTHFHSDDLRTPPAQFPNKMEIGSYRRQEEVRGLVEYDVTGRLPATEAQAEFLVEVFGGLFGQGPEIFQVQIVSYDGNNHEELSDFLAPQRIRVGSFVTEGIRARQRLSFDVTVPYNSVLQRGVPALGLRFQAGTNPGFGALTLIRSRLVVKEIRAPEPPVCDAGGPYVSGCRGASTDVPLNAAATVDANGDPLTFRWSTSCRNAVLLNAESARPVLRMTGTGSCTVTLVVSDGVFSDTCRTEVEVFDEAPLVECSLVPLVGGDLRVFFSSFDRCGVAKVEAVLETECGRVGIADGQRVRAICDPDRCETRWEGDVLVVAGRDPSVVVEATDNAGSTSRCVRSLCRSKGTPSRPDRDRRDPRIPAGAVSP